MELTSELTGTIFNIQRFSIQDGPGIRTTVFMKGCPLNCLWCSNPESQSSDTDIVHRDSICTGCGDCIQVCEEEAIHLIPNKDKFKIKIDRERCVSCGKCLDTCFPEALKAYGQTFTVDEVIDEVKRDVDFYSRSNGGVTAGGGEPLMQADFVAELFRRCREVGIHTTLDTSGHGPINALRKVLAETDLVLYDLKLMNSRRHKRYSGQNNQLILSNIRLIIERKIPLFVRIPLIPSINDDDESLNAMARFVSELDNTLHVDLLPYHRFGENKYKMLDKLYGLLGLEPPAEEQLQKTLRIFEKYGLTVALQE